MIKNNTSIASLISSSLTMLRNYATSFVLNLYRPFAFVSVLMSKSLYKSSAAVADDLAVID